MFHADTQTDGHDKANSRFPQFCERAQKPVLKETVDAGGRIHTATEHHHDPRNYVRHREFDHLGDYQLVKNDSAVYDI